MSKKIISVLLAVLFLIAALETVVLAKSYMSDKTEVPVNLEVSGAEALCQTEDGFVWIAQYSGLTRYDSKEFVTYKEAVCDGKKYDILNVRALATKDNVLYVGTSEHVFAYKNNAFSVLDYDFGTIKDIILDDKNDLLYVSTQTNGAVVYDIKNNTFSVLAGTEGQNINDVAIDYKRNDVFYQTDDGILDKNGNMIFVYPKILDIYISEDRLYIGQDDGIIHIYDLAEKYFLETVVVSDQINKFLYSKEDNILFVACETKGLFCVDFSTETPTISVADNLDNSSQLIDLMIDYEGNLWIASHYIGASGVSIITRNDLLSIAIISRN